MKLRIGENIKLYRKMKNLTQERFAEIFNVSAAAVCKWENGETYPDISLLIPLAAHMGLTLEELLGYGELQMESDIVRVIHEYDAVPNEYKFNGRNEIIIEGYKRFPHDYRIMHRYLFEISQGYADNNYQCLLDNKDELLKIAEKIIRGSNDLKMVIDAGTMKAKILLAEGKVDKALGIIKSFPTVFHSDVHRMEQLFPKDSIEYYEVLISNLHLVAKLFGDKLSKSIIHRNDPLDTKLQEINRIGDLLNTINSKENESSFLIIEYSF